MAAMGWWEKSKVHQTALKVEKLEDAAATSLHYGATAEDIANFPGLKNLSAGANMTFTVVGDNLELSAAGGGGGQAAIQFQDEGSNLGAAGTVDTLDFTGAGVTATRVGDVVTVNVPGSSGGQVDSVVAGDGIDVDATDPVNPEVSAKISADTGNQVAFGSDGGLLVNALSRTESASLVGGTGEDGAVDFDGTNTFSFASKSGSVYTLNRNIAPSVLRITTGVTVLPAGFCVWAQTWDCTSGFYGQFIGSGNPGNSTTTQSAGSQGLPRWSASSYFFPGSPGVNGTAATTTNSSNGSASGNAANAWGDKGSQGGRGGDSGANTAGTVGSAGSASGYVPFAGVLDRQFASLNSFTFYVAGTGATGGTGGAGDGTNRGGGGGGGGATGAGLHLFVGVLTTDATTPARIIDFRGGDGGNGATRVTGNVGGGGGGAGGHGGGVRMILGYHIGPAAVDFIDVSGGNGGNGGSGVGTGLDGTGGTSGASGRAQLYLYSSGAWSFTTLTAGTAAVGTAGQPGADGTLDIP